MTSVAALRLVVADRRAASRQAARLLADELASPRPVLGLATGSSVELVYEELAALVSRRSRAARSASGGRTGSRSTNTWAFPPEIPTATGPPWNASWPSRPDCRSTACTSPLASMAEDPSRYDEQISAVGGVAVQLLGIGGNGHIGFNEPGSPLDAGTRLITLDERTRQDNARFFASLAQVPTQAVTQGIGTILRARRLVLLAFGRAEGGDPGRRADRPGRPRSCPPRPCSATPTSSCSPIPTRRACCRLTARPRSAGGGRDGRPGRGGRTITAGWPPRAARGGDGKAGRWRGSCRSRTSG